MKRLYISEKDKKIAGVCGGIGEVYRLDSTVIRLLFIFLALTTGIIPLVVTYLIAWIIIPKKSAIIEREESNGVA